MAKVFNVLRTCGILFYLIFKLCAAENFNGEPWIVSFSTESKSCRGLNCKYLLYVRGGEFLGHYSWRITPKAGFRGSSCDVIYPNYEIKEVETKQWFTKVDVFVPITKEKVYFCLRYPGQHNNPADERWVHQGPELFLEPGNELETKTVDLTNLNQQVENLKITISDVRNNDLQGNTKNSVDLSHDIDVNYLPNTPKASEGERDDIEVRIEEKYVPLESLKKRHNKNLKELGTQFGNRNREYSILNMLGKPLYRKQNSHVYDIKSNNIKRRKRGLQLDINAVTPEYINNDSNGLVKREIISNPKVDDASKDSEIFTENKDRSIFDFADQKKEKEKEDFAMMTRNQRQAFSLIGDDFSAVRADQIPILIEGVRIDDSEKEPKVIDGVPSVLANTKVVLRVFGQGLTPRTVIAFTHDPMDYGQPCKFLLKGEYVAQENSVAHNTALFEFWAPQPIAGSNLYICAKNLPLGVSDPNMDESKYLHQGIDTYKMLATHNKLLPLWVSLILILVCLMFSALFSGLNLGLMSLDRTELKIISNTGTEQERKYARAIMPVRDHGNYLLCSILLGNVAVNSTFTILLDELTSGLYAVIFSTLLIVLLGEITPQAICSRHGLMVGAKSIMVTKAVMGLTAPLAFPVSKLLDYFLGEEIGSVYNRERLKELVKVTTDVNDLDKDEVNIISGALELRKKSVADVMTKLEDVFMLPITSVLDFETMSEIVKSGYSRIPVYEASRSNIITVLFIKDLAFVDPDDNTPLRTLCQYYQNPCNFVFEDVTLDVMFKQFKEGHKGHMAFVHRINNEGEGDPFYETIGLVTLEDVIEEMIQAEIVDETDVFMDNRTKRRRNRPQNKLQDFAAFAERHENQRIHISPQLTLATFQFLSTSVDAFRPDTVSETVLRRLLKQDVIHYIKLKGKTKKEPSTYVYQQGKAVDYFVLILEGRVEVTVGRENLVFEAGPFTYFGVQALTQNIGVAESPTPSAMGSLQNINMDAMLRHTFVPDYSVRAITELYYLTVKRSLYLAAKRATLMEKGALSKGAINEQFDTEVDKQLTVMSDTDMPSTSRRSTRARSVVSRTMPTSSSPESSSDKSSPKPNMIELMQVRPNDSPSSVDSKRVADIGELPGSNLRMSGSREGYYASPEREKSVRISEDITLFENHLKSRTSLVKEEKRESNDVEMSKTVKLLKEESEDECSSYGHVSLRGSEVLEYIPPHCFTLLQSVDEDISISGEHKTPSRQDFDEIDANEFNDLCNISSLDGSEDLDMVSPNPVPTSASPLTRASFTSRASPEPRDSYTTKDEQEKLLK